MEWKAQNCGISKTAKDTYAAKIRSEDGTFGDRKWSRIWIRTCLDAFEGSILELLAFYSQYVIIYINIIIYKFIGMVSTGEQ